MSEAGDFGLNLYGASYHFERREAKARDVANEWRLGGALALVHSDTYNRGRSFVAPFPVAAYEWRAVTFNVTYIPKVSRVNDINTLGFWVTFYP